MARCTAVSAFDYVQHFKLLERLFFWYVPVMRSVMRFISIG